MTTLDPTTITPDQLHEMLAAWAAGYYPEEAAVGLLARGCDGHWLRRTDFLTACVDAVADGWTSEPARDGKGVPMAGINWLAALRFLDEGGPASSGEARLLRTAASIAGFGSAPIRDLARHLDENNVRAVLDTIARLAGWHELGITHITAGRRATPTGAGRPRAGVVTRPEDLPTFEQIRAEAYRVLGDAADWLRSDWRPGSAPPAAVLAVVEARDAIHAAKAALNMAADSRTDR